MRKPGTQPVESLHLVHGERTGASRTRQGDMADGLAIAANDRAFGRQS